MFDDDQQPAAPQGTPNQTQNQAPPPAPPKPNQGGSAIPDLPKSPESMPVKQGMVEDIFADTETGQAPALPNNIQNTQQVDPIISELTNASGSGGRRIIVIVLVTLVIILVSLGVMIGLNRLNDDSNDESAQDTTTEVLPEESNQMETTPEPEPEPVVESEPEPELEPDRDGDGLTDIQENQVGTNPSIGDTDGDGLSDAEEIFMYSTNPLNPDTDGDSFSDGQEVANGYNPNGEGTMAEIPNQN